MTDLPPGVVPESEFRKKRPDTSAPPPGVIPESQAKVEPHVDYRGETLVNPVMAQGMTFGFSDEMAGVAKAAKPFLSGDIEGAKKAYNQGRKEELARVRQYRQEHPYWGTASELVGGLGVGGGIRSGTSKLAQLFGRLPDWMKSTGLGALWGSLYGAGTSEPGQRLSGAAIGGTAGAATAGIMHGTVKGGQWAYKHGADYVRALRDPQGQATRLLGEKMHADQLTAPRVRGRLRQLGPQATLTDAGGENVVGLARGAAGQPGPAKQRVMQTLNQRAGGEAERIRNTVTKNLGPGDYFAAEDRFLAKLKQGAGEAYHTAYEANPSVMTPKLEKILRSSPMRRALKEAADIAEIQRAAGKTKWLGPVDKELTDMARYAADLGKMERVPRPGVAKGFSLETWDHLKKGVDSLLDKPAYRNELTGALNKKGFAVDQLRRALIKQLDAATGGDRSLYAAARKQYSGDAEVIGALREGAKFMRQAPEEIQKALANLSEAGKAAYRNGAARAVTDIVESVPDKASAANRLFNKSINRKKIQAVFPNPDKFRDFSRRMVAEQRFADVKNAIGAGSRTAPMSAEIADIQQKVGNLGAILGSSMSGGGHALVKAGIGRRMAQKLLGSPEAMNRELAKLLTTRNRAEQLRILDQMSPQMRERIQASPLLRGIVLGTIQQEAGAINQ